MIHQTEMVVGEENPQSGRPRRAGGLAAWGVSHVSPYAASDTVRLKLLTCFDGRVASEEVYGGVQQKIPRL